jgi:PAS domain S-box-containing protein
VATLLCSLAVAAWFSLASAAEPPRTIRVVLDSNYAPYSFRSDDGALQGILVDQWKAWERKTGIKAEIHAMDWDDALRRMRAGEFDVIDSIFATDERRRYLDFSQAYTQVEASIFFRKDIAGITDLASLKGFPVGVKAGDEHINALKESGVTTVIPFQNYDAMIEAARQRNLNVFVIDDPAAMHALHKMGIEADFRHSEPVFRDQLRRAVRKGDADLLRTVSAGFAAIGPDEMRRIDERWFGQGIRGYSPYLNYAGYAAALALLLIAALAAWNRMLRKTARESERRYLSLFENMGEGVVYLQMQVEEGRPRDATYLEVNPAWEKLSGWRNVVGRKVSEVTSGQANPEFVERCARVAMSGQPDRFEIYSSLMDKWLAVSAYSPGKERVIAVLDDITERKHAEDHLRLVIDTIPTMAWSLLPDGAIEFLNQRWLEYTGLTLREALEDVTRIVHPEDLPRAMEEWRVNMAAKQGYEDAMRLRGADGAYRWFLVRTVPFTDERGEVVRWYGTSTDIEDRKRAEDALRESDQRFRQIAGNIREVFWMTTLDPDELLYVSPAYEKVWGRSLESMRKQPRSFIDAIHSEDRERARSVLGDKRELGFEVEYRIVRPDGSIRWIRDRGFPVKDADGRVYRVAGVAEDITERKHAENALRTSGVQLQALSRRLVDLQEAERKELSRELHDRVGQSLTALKINIDILLLVLAPQASQEVVARVTDSAALLDATINTIENVMSELRPPMLDDHGLAAALDWHAKNFSTRTGIAVVVLAGDPAVRPSSQIEIALFRIAQEALNNVAKHAGARRVEVALDCANGECVMSVQDDGVGFGAGNASDKKPGLGMVTMRERAQAVGGRFEAQSLRDRGTRLTVRIPY